MDTELIKSQTLKIIGIGGIIALLMSLFLAGEGVWYLIVWASPGILALSIYSWFFSAKIYQFFHNQKISYYFSSFFLGVVLLILAIFSGALFLSIIRLRIFDFPLYFIGSLYFISIYGAIPLTILAAIHARWLEKESQNQESSSIVRHFSISLFSIIGILFIAQFLYIYVNRAVPEKVILPRDFSGEFIIIFDQIAGQKEQKMDGHKIYQIPYNGVLITQAKPSEGFHPSRQFWTYSVKDTPVEVGYTQFSISHLEYDAYLSDYGVDCQVRYQSFYFGNTERVFKKSYQRGQKIRNYLKAHGYICKGERLYRKE